MTSAKKAGLSVAATACLKLGVATTALYVPLSGGRSIGSRPVDPTIKRKGPLEVIVIQCAVGTRSRDPSDLIFTSKKRSWISVSQAPPNRRPWLACNRAHGFSVWIICTLHLQLGRVDTSSIRLKSRKIIFVPLLFSRIFPFSLHFPIHIVAFVIGCSIERI